MKHVADENPTAMPPIQMKRKKKNAQANDVTPRAIEGIRRCIASSILLAPSRVPMRLRGCSCTTSRSERGLCPCSSTARCNVSEGGPWGKPKVSPRDQKFTEPVALSSSEPGDFPLPRTVSRLGFDLLALRARCKGEVTARCGGAQGRRRRGWRYLRTLLRAQPESALRAACSKKAGPEIRRPGGAFVHPSD